MNRYILKSYTRSKNTIYRAGAAVASTITSTVNIENISICLNRGCEESVSNDGLSIVCASKNEKVRMT